jgi:hypothetical protein
MSLAGLYEHEMIMVCFKVLKFDHRSQRDVSRRSAGENDTPPGSSERAFEDLMSPAGPEGCT